MVKNNFDVVIVGAGPAGLSAAKILGQSGKNVLILEKNSTIGPKVCAGGLTDKDFKHFGIPENLIENKFAKVIYKTPLLGQRNVWLGDLKLCTIDRLTLGQWQAKQLERFSNVKIITGQSVTKIGDGYVETANGKKYNFDDLIGADGSFSIVRRYLGLPSERLIAALHYIVPEKFLEMELCFEPSFFKSGYAWIFPYKKSASIGFGWLANRYCAKTMKGNFTRWLQKRNIDIKNAKYEAFAINCDFRGYKFGNIYLAGDAAGLASSLNGEGIYQAMISGEEIARLIMNPKHNPTRLKKVIHQMDRHAKALKILDQSATLRKILVELISILFLIPFCRRFILKKML